jgi:hypothetical protein
MTTYIANKLNSFLGVFICIAFTYALFGNTVAQWQAILITIVIFGYGHFLLGFYYQIKGFFRKENPWQYVGSFVFLTLLSISLSYALFYFAGFAAALFIGFLYFLLHGLLNEQTLIERQTGHVVPLLHLGALAIFVIALLTYSIPDKTFFFDQHLQFTDVSLMAVTFIFEQYYLGLAAFGQIFWIGFGLSLLTLLISWFKYGYTKLTFVLLGAIVGATAAVSVYGPPAYIYMYVFVVGYHFMTWVLFYLVEMKKRGSTVYRKFIFHNVLAVAPFVIAAYFFYQPNTPALAYALLNLQLFVVMTYIHISTSFLNDEWMVDLQDRFFRLFSRSPE